MAYSIVINYRVKQNSKREEWVLEAAKEYSCEPDTHLFDRLLQDRRKLFAAHKAELARIAAVEAQAAEDKRRAMGG